MRRRSETTLIIAISQHIMSRFTTLSEYSIKNYVQTLRNVWKWTCANCIHLNLLACFMRPWTALRKTSLNSPKPAANKDKVKCNFTETEKCIWWHTPGFKGTLSSSYNFQHFYFIMRTLVTEIGNIIIQLSTVVSHY